MHRRHYYVYIMANLSRTLYVGVTSNLYARVAEHKAGDGSAFTSRYKLKRLVYVETTTDVHAALQREKQLKGWTRSRKIELIEALNPDWNDMSSEWDQETDPSLRSG